MRFYILFIVLLLITALASAVCAEQFKDVPKDHWAAEHVQRAADAGVIKGYPDAVFRGDKAVTRYELAVALERMIAYIEGSLREEVKSQKLKVAGPDAPSAQPSPVKGEGDASPKPKAESQDPAERLKTGGYIAANSPLLTNKNGTVSPAELSQALSSVAAKLIDKHVPEPKD